MTDSIGTHCILELYDCPPERLNDRDFVAGALRRAAQAAGASLLSEVAHAFTPQGVTALGLLAESHISIHTWPELGYAGADIFTCGRAAIPERACASLVESFAAGRHELRTLARGPQYPADYAHAAQTPAPPIAANAT